MADEKKKVKRAKENRTLHCSPATGGKAVECQVKPADTGDDKK